jgi:hypothetical protein
MEREFKFEFKLNQVPFAKIHCYCKMKSCRLHNNGYSGTRGVTILMNDIFLHSFIGKFLVFYFNSILNYGKSFDEHIEDLCVC